MAKGLNKKFLSNPLEFFRQKYFGNQAHLQAPVDGEGDIDFIPTIDPITVLLANYQERQHHPGAQPIHAYYLPAIRNNSATLVLGDRASYLFTASLSGCMFAAYGPDARHVTVEHVNEFDDSPVVPIDARVQQILNQNYPFCRIVQFGDIPNHGNQYFYNNLAMGMGILHSDGWHFYLKPDIGAAEYIEL